MGTEAANSLFQMPPLDIMSLLKLALVGVVTLVMGLFVLRPILSKPAPVALPSPSGDSPVPALQALTGEIDEGNTDLSNLSIVSAATGDIGTLPARSSEDAVERLRNLINDRRDETVEILRSWLEDEEEEA
jgi:flagellar M-ring protein FliF